MTFVVASSSFAGASASEGLYAEASSYSHLLEQPAAGHIHSISGAVNGMEHDDKAPCQSFMDCGCAGCQRGDGVIASASAVEGYLPIGGLTPVRFFISEDLSIPLAAIYVGPQIDLPQRPPKYSLS